MGVDAKKKRRGSPASTCGALLALFCFVAICILGFANVSNPAITNLSPAEIAKRAIQRYTDITVLEAEKSKTHKGMLIIEYDLKPIIFIPNELIHNDKVMAMICALRKSDPIKHSYSFVGMGRFRDRYGKLVHRRSVASDFNARDMMRIGCDRGRSAHDVDWEKLSTYYRSYPIPSGLEVDI